jgi:4-methylaminobutanoate oxidase (formaldehyde-forming)
MEVLTPSEAQKLWPPMRVDDVVGAAFLPTDGQANPADITQALAKGARAGGVTIIEDCRVTAIATKQGRVTGVVTAEGAIAADVVVNCAGQWAREVGRLCGVNVALQSVQHQYLVTEPIDGVPRNLPTLRDPDRLIYGKEEVGGLVVGGYEPNPIAWALKGIPEGFHFSLLESDWDHFEPMMGRLLGRIPALETAGIKQLINGPESFTPDGNFILGEAPELKNFYVGAGFNAFGIASGGGAGKALAEWVAAGEPPMDLWPVDIRRFGSVHQDPQWVLTRTLEAYAPHYSMAWPHEELESARPVRVSPLYERLKAQGACFGSKLGWERPNWFAPDGVEPKDIYSYERQNWFEHVGAEHRAVRERVGVFDQTSFAKFMMIGRDAELAMSWICANDVAKAPGRLIYTQMLNRQGGIECDVTVTRLTDESYYIITGTGFATHDFSWIERAIPQGLDARLIDVTSAFAVLSVMGPRSRDTLSAASGADFSNAAFPFGSWQTVMIAGTPVRALRVTYVGELGWELHFPVECAGAVYDAVMGAGQPHGIVNAGYRAIESLRLEKGYRAWGSDITPNDTPFEAGLGWAVKLKSNVPFLGRDAIGALQGKPLRKRLATFTPDREDIVLLGRETILRNGEAVGYLTSGGYGYTIGKPIGLGYVRHPEPEAGSYELVVANERVAASISFEPLYDPQNLKVKV